MKKFLMIASLALTSTVPALAATEQPKTVDAKDATALKVEKADKAKESPKAKKAQKHSKKHSEAPKVN
jgi:hypothetical protein